MFLALVCLNPFFVSILFDLPTESRHLLLSASLPLAVSLALCLCLSFSLNDSYALKTTLEMPLLSFRCLWIYRVQTRQVVLIRTFPTVQHRHRCATAALKSCGASHNNERSSEDSPESNVNAGGSTRRLPGGRKLGQLLARALGDESQFGHLPLLQLGDSQLWPAVAVFRPGYVFIGLPLVPAAAVERWGVHSSASDAGKELWGDVWVC